MEKNQILQKFKEKITENGGEPKELLSLQEADIELGEEQQVYCRTYEYTCTGVGQKFGGDFRFPLTKTYKSDAKWFFKGEKETAEKFLINYIGDKKIYEELGGCFEDSNIYKALCSDAFWKLRADFRMYDCRVLPESISIDDSDELSESSPVFRPIYRNSDPQKKTIGYIAKNASGEVVLIEKNYKNSKRNNSGNGNNPKPNWFLIIVGIFCPPVLFIYLIYLLCKKK